MWRSAGSGPVNPQDLTRSADALNIPLPATDPTGHLPLLPVLLVGGLALLKAIDDGWTAWDAFQATRTLADPEAPAEEKRTATANLALTAALEAAEPDDLLPVGFPLDDLLRVGIIGGSKGADAGRVVARGGAEQITIPPNRAGHIFPKQENRAICPIPQKIASYLSLQPPNRQIFWVQTNSVMTGMQQYGPMASKSGFRCGATPSSTVD